MRKTDVVVLGAGNMGTAVAQVLALRGHQVRLWDYDHETVEAIARKGVNKQFLPGVKLSRRIVAEASMEQAVENAALVIVACASPYVRATARQLAHCLGITPPSSPYLSSKGGSASGGKGRGQLVRPPLKSDVSVGLRTVASEIRGDRGVMKHPVVAHIAKGLEAKTNLTMHEVIQSELLLALRRRVVTISGPSIAKELVAGVPTAVVAASQDARAAEFVRSAFEYLEIGSPLRRRSNLPVFHVATSRDWKGVSICGALKNVYAIALGMCDGYTRNTTERRPRGGRATGADTEHHGIGLPMNAKAFLCTVALDEMAQVVQVLGGKRDTVYGLAGIGDLVVTGLGQGRNRALGERICREGSCKFLLKDKNAQTHEGVAAAKVFYNLALRGKISAPLIKMVYSVLYNGVDPCKAVQLFFRAIKI